VARLNGGEGGKKRKIIQGEKEGKRGEKKGKLELFQFALTFSSGLKRRGGKEGRETKEGKERKRGKIN